MSLHVVQANQAKCRFCGCTAETPCTTEFNDECCFLGSKADRCSSKQCVLAFDRERDEERLREAHRRKTAALIRRDYGRKKGGRR